jgi:hypothetical protein
MYMIYRYYAVLLGLRLGGLGKLDAVENLGRSSWAGAVMSKKTIGRCAVRLIIDIAK